MAHTATGRVLEDTPRNADKVGPAMRESFDHLPRMSMGEMNAAAGSKDRPLRLWLLSASSQQGVTFYRIAGRFTTNGQTWEVNRRYSEFLALRDKLVKFLSTSPDTCPGCEHYLHALKLFAFPKKHFIASRTPLVVNYRVKALRAFVNLLASWTFSTSPKCPTCGGYAFDIVRNFFVDTAAPLTGSDMDYIRESIVVEAFSGSGERSSGLTRRNSWIPASASTTLQQQEQQRMTQSARNIAPQRHSMMEQPIQSQRQAQSQRHTMMEHPSQAPRSSQGYRPSQSQRSGQPQSSRGSVSSTRKSMPRIASAPPARSAQSDRRTNMINDAAYDMFNDYLPERPAHLKKPAHKNTEGGGDNAKFSALSLAEEARLREQQLEKQRSTLSSTGSGKLQGYPEKPSQTYSRGSSSAASGSRSDPRQRAQSAPRDSYQHSAHGQSGSSRGAGNGPNVQRAARGQPAPMFDSFLSESSTGSMAAEPVFVHGDELRRYGIAASSDEEGKFDTSEDEIDITGVALASPPRSRRKTTSGDNLWQPWELAKVA